MRISEDRYSREQQSLDVAMGFLRHEARTQTIRAWTGLSAHRIRALYNSYVRDSPSYVPRHRGKSPRQSAYFTRSLRMLEETSTLTRMLSLAGTLPPGSGTNPQSQPAPGLARGRLVVCAYEMYKAHMPSGSISFEHTVFLTSVLSRAEHILLGNCADCTAMAVIERNSRQRRRCLQCTLDFTRS
jgi:hypothetical protein